MAKAPGRAFLLKKNTVTIAGGLAVGIKYSGTPISVMDQGSLGIQEYLSGVMTDESLEITIEGYEEDQTFRDIAFGSASGKFLSDITLEFPNGGNTISGNFVLDAYGEDGPLADGQKFNGTLKSNGAWTYT